MKKLVIDRSKWLRGESPSYLLTNDGSMCCLGFWCKSQGIEDDAIIHRGLPTAISPRDLIKAGVTDMEPFLGVNRPWMWDMFASINDDTSINDSERETKLEKLFNNIGYTVEFIN